MNSLLHFLRTSKQRQNSKKIMRWFAYYRNHHRIHFCGSENSFQLSVFDSRLEIKKEGDYFSAKPVYVHKGYVFGDISKSESKSINIVPNDLLYATFDKLYELNRKFLKEEHSIHKAIDNILQKVMNVDDLRWRRKRLESSIKLRFESEEYERNVLGKALTSYSLIKDKEELSKITAILDEWDNLHCEMRLLERKYSEQIRETLSLVF